VNSILNSADITSCDVSPSL